MKYLTRSYVEALGLDIIPIHKPRNPGFMLVSGDRLLQVRSSWAVGVDHRGHLYEREPDGLAYVRLD